MGRVPERGDGTVYFDDKLGGKLGIPGTAASPEFSFDVTIVEIELVEGQAHVGRFGVLEIQTADFHGSYGVAVRNLKDTLHMFAPTFAATLQTIDPAVIILKL